MADSEAEILFELEIRTPTSHMHSFGKRSESSKFKIRKKCSIWGANDVCLENAYCHLIQIPIKEYQDISKRDIIAPGNILNLQFPSIFYKNGQEILRRKLLA